METKTHILEVLQTEILARLPLKSISRFKSVCKKWKSTLESVYFRRLFLSLNRNSFSSFSSWSLVYEHDELIVFYGCKKTWDLPKSPASLIPPSFKRYYIGDCEYRDSSSGLVLITDGSDKAYCYVGSPVTQQWVKIPPPPSDPTGVSTVFGLVTRLDEDGVVLRFKLIRLPYVKTTDDYYLLSVFVYFSETGVWTSKVVHCPHQIGNLSNINLNGTIYFGCLSVPGLLLAHDFYSESDQFRVVGLPDYPDYNNDYKRTLTTSGGFVMYVRTLARKEETVLKIWRLNNDDDTWLLLWEVGFPIIGNYAPMAMHPFDVATVYLWSQDHHHFVSCNLQKQDYTVLGDASNDGHQDCFVDKSVCKQSVDELWRPRSSSDVDEHLDFTVCIWLFQFVIPRWIESVPRPPQAEMIDTTSLLSHAAATHERMMKDPHSETLFFLSLKLYSLKSLRRHSPLAPTSVKRHQRRALLLSLFLYLLSVSVHLFRPRYSELCSSSVFAYRRACSVCGFRWFLGVSVRRVWVVQFRSSVFRACARQISVFICRSPVCVSDLRHVALMRKLSG